MPSGRHLALVRSFVDRGRFGDQINIGQIGGGGGGGHVGRRIGAEKKAKSSAPAVGEMSELM